MHNHGDANTLILQPFLHGPAYVVTRCFAPRAAYAARYARSGRKSTSKDYCTYAKRTVVHGWILFFIIIVVANWRLDNAKSPAAMLQEKTARTPHTLRLPGGCRTYIPQVRYLFSFFDMMYVRKTRKHSTAQQHRKNNVNEIANYFGKKKKSPSLL